MKGIIAILITLLVLLQYKLWLGDGGIPDVLQMQKEVALKQQQRHKLQERNKGLDAEVSDLKKGLDAIEERARSELGMIGKNEKFYHIMPPTEK